jgi:hypothetical protein
LLLLLQNQIRSRGATVMVSLAEQGFGAHKRTYRTILCVQFCWLLSGCAEAYVICKLN